jgi:hypothetical protein
LTFWGDDIVQVQHCPSDQTTAPNPSEIQINQHEERPFKDFTPQASMVMFSSRAYQKLSSNGLDLAELEPKPVDLRQIRPPVAPKGRSCVKIPVRGLAALAVPQ